MIPTLLISQESFNLYSLTTSNLNPEKVKPFIILAQENWLRPLLGYILYEKLQEEVKNETISEPNKLLLSKIAQPLALQVDYLSLRSLAYQITEKGLTKEKSDNSESLNDKELGQFKLDIDLQFKMAEVSLTDWLCCNKMDFIEWTPSDNTICNHFEETKDVVGDVNNRRLIGLKY